MISLFWLDVIVYGTLAYFLWVTTGLYHLRGQKKGLRAAKADIKKTKTYQLRTNILLLFSRFFLWFYDNIGTKPSLAGHNDLSYRLDRLGYEFKHLGRGINTRELYGFFTFAKILGSLLALVGYFSTMNPLFFIFLTSYAYNIMFIYYADRRIYREDLEIERDFSELYLLLYSRLVKGSYTRLAPTLASFLNSKGTKKGQGIYKFASDLYNSIEIYGDDSIAIDKIRLKYRSPNILNFCNLAVQALKGVDNTQKLFAFKVELSQKRLALMQRKADELVRKGSLAITSLYIVLFQFVLLTWLAKLGGVEGMRNMFSMFF